MCLCILKNINNLVFTCNKNVDINCVRTPRFLINLHRLRSLLKYKKCTRKPNNINIFGSNKTNGPKQDSQNWLRTSIPERREP